RKTLLLTPFFNFYGEVQSEDISEYRPSSKDSLFYLILGLWFYFALIRLFFSKYLDNIFALFFRATMRQQQIREQALQMPLPSLLLNILFALSTGLFATFLVRYYYDPAKTTEFWALYLYCVIAVAVVYIVKFLIFKLLGWIFNIKKATGNYLFVVFLVNKMMGICLLPFLMFIAFSGSGTVDVAIAISFLMIAVFFLYRYITCFGTVAAEIKLTVFHYFLYLCAFEIAPLLLMYKVVFSFFEKAF
ncbi:MAG: DUF4271 domain-containing protein, partial [Bacteroidetes bacterium]|nr:DUF4271 domain-containing protein [Bacteroidota bacterium]